FCKLAAKPSFSMSTLYEPMGRKVIAYLPEPSDTTLRTKLIFTFVAVITAPGTTAPLLSETVPSMVPVAWAQADCEAAQSQINKKVVLIDSLGCIPLLQSRS